MILTNDELIILFSLINKIVDSPEDYKTKHKEILDKAKIDSSDTNLIEFASWFFDD